MQYDIYFDPQHAKWRIRMVYTFLFVFTTTREVYKTEGNDDKVEPVAFDDFAGAEAYVKSVGLDKAYSRRYPRSTVSFTEAINGTAHHPQPTAQVGFLHR